MPSSATFSLPKSRDARTPEEARKVFDRLGLSVAEWARQNQLPYRTVMELLHGRQRGRRGHAHRAAVLLGLKDGVLPDSASAPTHRPSQARPLTPTTKKETA